MTAGALLRCEWADEPHHPARHHGYPCPYVVLAALAAGERDPRELVAEWRVDISTVLKPNGSLPLSLNDAHGNAFAVNTARKRIKNRVRNHVRDAQVPVLPRLHVELHCRPKTNAARDPDNAVATLKPCIDALHQPDPESGWQPIVAGDDPRYVSWSQPIYHPAQRGAPPLLWLMLRTYGEPS